MLQRAPEAIYLPHQHSVKLAPEGVSHKKTYVTERSVLGSHKPSGNFRDPRRSHFCPTISSGMDRGMTPRTQAQASNPKPGLPENCQTAATLTFRSMNARRSALI